MTTAILRAEQVIHKWERDADRVLSAPWERTELVTAIAALIAEVREGERERYANLMVDLRNDPLSNGFHRAAFLRAENAIWKRGNRCLT